MAANTPTRSSPAAHRLLRGAAVVGILLGACASKVQADDLAARRAEIARMQPAEQQELLRKQERFAALPQEEQDRLRALQAAVDADPHATQLHLVLARYHEWLKTLTSSQRAELAALPTEQRVQQIKRLQRQQQAARERAHHSEVLSKQDKIEIVRWLEDFVWKRREAVIASLSREQREKFDKGDAKAQRRIVLYKSFERARRGSKSGSPIGLSAIEQQDIDRLQEKLSPAAKQELAQAGELSTQRRLLFAWVGMSLHAVDAAPHPRHMAPLMGEELVQFLENDVPAQEREELLKLPPDQGFERIRGMYFQRGRELEPGGPGRWMPGGPFDRPGGRFEGPPRGEGGLRGGGPQRSGEPRGAAPRKIVPSADAAPLDQPAGDIEQTDKPQANGNSPPAAAASDSPSVEGGEVETKSPAAQSPSTAPETKVGD